MTLDDLRQREHFSYSSINQFFNICSLQWAFQRAYQLKPAFTPVSLAFGSAFHRVLEYVTTQRHEGTTPKNTDAADLFQDLWERQVVEDANIRFDEDITRESCGVQGRDMVTCVVDNIDPEEEVLEVNEVFAIPIEGNERPLIGELDCVVKKNGKRLVVDWKSAARRWPKDKAEKDLQPTAILYAYQQSHGILPDFRFDVVVKNKTPVLEQHVTSRNADNFKRLTHMIQLMDKMVRQEHFCPNEQSFYCNGCPFSDACKAWHRSQHKVITTGKAA